MIVLNSTSQDSVVLDVATSVGAVLWIAAPGGLYRYNGDPAGAQEFFPNEPGNYTASLLDPLTGETVASVPFGILGGPAGPSPQFLDMAVCGVVNESANLTQDVAIDGASCFLINASNIVFDCVGHSIAGNDTPGTYGILVDNADNVTIRNCTVTDFGQGILINGTSGNNTLENDTVLSSVSVGINVTDNAGSGSTIAGSVFCGSGALDAYDADSNSWSGNACDNATGGASCATPCANIEVTSPDIVFGNESRVEGGGLTVFATVRNTGYRDITEGFIVRFYNGDPNLNGTQLGQDHMIDGLAMGENMTVNETMTLALGKNEVYVAADAGGNVSESNETDNNASADVTVGIYQFYHGIFLREIVLEAGDNGSLIVFSNQSGKDGYVLVADSDSAFDFADLQALTRRTDNTSATDDLSDADTNLNTTGYNDSLRNAWGNGTEAPLATMIFNLTSHSISNIPVVDSTNTSAFVTGILWDTADDTSDDGEYDTTDKEDLVFITRINASQQGAYGISDYEIRVPAPLKAYKGTQEELALYYEVK